MWTVCAVLGSGRVRTISDHMSRKTNTRVICHVEFLPQEVDVQY